MVKEQRKLNRRSFSYYMPVKDAESARQVGIMTDISLRGFKLDCRQPVPSGQVRRFRLDLTAEVAPRAFLEFAGRSKWCHPDYIEPSTYNVGFEIVDITPDDARSYQRVFEIYGSQTVDVPMNR